MSESIAPFDFNAACDEVLTTISSESYDETVRRIDELEKKAKVADPNQDPQVSCADLRLLAAILTGQPLSECERKYDALVQVGADATTRLQMATLLVRKSPSVTPATLERLERAIEESESRAPSNLLAQAKSLLAGRS